MDEANRPNILNLPERNATQAAGDQLRREIDAMIENQKVLAKLRRAAFLAYIEEGFTVEQALQLCTK